MGYKEDSVLVIGAVGSGKSLVTRELHKITSFPLVPIDTFRHLPKMDVIERVLNNHNTSAEERNIFTKYRILREKFPNIKNYKDFGFNVLLSERLWKRGNYVGWHMYHKKFEIKLLEELFSKITVPCIYDFGGGSPIYLKEEYQKMYSQAKKEDIELKRATSGLFLALASPEKKIKKLIGQFSNVIYLKLPEDYKEYNKKATEDPLNELFIKNGGFETVATKTIKSRRLTNGEGGVNLSAARSIAHEILDNCLNCVALKNKK